MTFRQSVGDFYAPFFRVRFIDAKKIDGLITVGPDGEEVLNIQDEGVTAEAVQAGDTSTFLIAENQQMSQLRSFASSLTITTVGGHHTTAQFNMEPQYEDALRIIDSEAIQWNTLMVVEYGYLAPKQSITKENKYSKLGVFMIQKPDLTLSADGAQIEIVGVDILSYNLVKKATYRTWMRSQHKSDLDIVKAVIQRNGMTLNTEKLVVRGVSIDLNTLPGLEDYKHPIEAEQTQDLVQHESDWTFFQRILYSNNCSFYTRGATVYLIDMDAVKGAQANYRLLMFAQPVEDYDVPMLSFSTGALPTLFWPTEAKGIRAGTVNPDTGKPENATQENSEQIENYEAPADPKFNHLGPKGVPGGDDPNAGRSGEADGANITANPKNEDDQVGKGYYMPWGTPNRQEMAKQPAKRATQKSGINAEVTVIGTPAIESFQIVEVIGVGGIMSGFYLVQKVTHILDTGGYESQLELIREGTTGDPVKGKGEAPASEAKPKSAGDGAPGDAVPAEVAGD